MVASAFVAIPARALAVACPVAVTDFRLVGRSDAAAAYAITLSDSSNGGVAATLEVSSAGGQKGDLVVPAAGSENRTRAVFAWPGGDLRSARIKAFGPPGSRDVTACVGRAAVIDDGKRTATTVVFPNDALRVSERLTRVDDGAPAPATDADFVRRVSPAYPAEAMRSGVSGDVGVLVDVSTIGKATNAVVVSSSQFAWLDEAAVTAALASIYKPPTLEGRPASRRLKISYTFKAGAQNPAVGADTKCHARINYGWLIGIDRSSGKNLYEIGLSADRGDIESVDVSLQHGDIAPPIASGHLAWEKRASGSYTTAVFALDSGTLAGTTTLESVDLRGGTQTLSCAEYAIVTWDRTSGLLGSGTIPTALPVETAKGAREVVRPAAFVHRVWPGYPRGPDGDRPQRSTTLVIHADATGKPNACAVYRSSGSEVLDAEAVKAALASSYQPTGSVAVYIAWYEFHHTLTTGAINR